MLSHHMLMGAVWSWSRPIISLHAPGKYSSQRGDHSINPSWKLLLKFEFKKNRQYSYLWKRQLRDSTSKFEFWFAMKGLLILCLLAVGVQLGRAAGNGDGEKEDVGTVIGIDLGTTYSWWVACLESHCLRFSFCLCCALINTFLLFLFFLWKVLQFWYVKISTLFSLFLSYTKVSESTKVVVLKSLQTIRETESHPPM